MTLDFRMAMRKAGEKSPQSPSTVEGGQNAGAPLMGGFSGIGLLRWRGSIRRVQQFAFFGELQRQLDPGAALDPCASSKKRNAAFWRCHPARDSRFFWLSLFSQEKAVSGGKSHVHRISRDGGALWALL